MTTIFKIIVICIIIFLLYYIIIEKPELLCEIKRIKPFLIEFKVAVGNFACIMEQALNKKDYGQLALGINDLNNYMKNNAGNMKILFAFFMALFVVIGSIFLEFLSYIQRHKLLLFIIALLVALKCIFMRTNFKRIIPNMYKRKTILYLVISIIFLAVISTATPITNGVKSNTERYFGQIMKELNEAFKEKAAEEKKHISLLLNMTEEIKELNEQVRGMQKKIENIAG